MATMKFYMTPGSCSTGIHILLEEVGAVFEAYIVNLLTGDQNTDDYRAINPKGTIPTLVRDDGSALSEFQAIAWWLARRYPKRGLLPESAEGEARVLEMMGYVVHTLHGQGFARIFTTAKFTPNEADHAAVQAEGRRIVDAAFAVVDAQLAGREYVAERYGIADAALFYVEFWAVRTGVPLPPNCQAHYRRLLTRPAVRQVLQEEGYASALREAQPSPREPAHA
jgi:glutathione S-transferase